MRSLGAGPIADEDVASQQTGGRRRVESAVPENDLLRRCPHRASSNDSLKNGAWKDPSSCSAAALWPSPQRRKRREAPPGATYSPRRGFAPKGRLRKRSKGLRAPPS
jgi:hypothetical protein